jgi:hypothetical protein
MATTVTLVHPNETLQVPGKLLLSKCDVSAEDPGLTAVPYHVTSRVSVSDFREFVSALQDTTVKVTNKNFKELSLLCEEFRFRDLGAQLSQFLESGNLTEDAVLLSSLKKQLLAMEEEMQHGKREIASLRREVSRVQESLKERIRIEVEKHVGEVRSEVYNLRNALREVRELAEGAQMKAESTEAHLGRVARLEAEVSALRTAAVDEIRSELEKLRIALRELTNPSGWDSAIVPDFPKLFEDFKRSKFTLLWPGSRDGFRADPFHRRCDRHPNTLTMILDMDDNIFGGFAPSFLIAMEIVHPVTKSNSELG